MQQIEFNFPDILGSLLNKTKTTTIRQVKYWEQRQGIAYSKVEKPCKYQVGKEYDVVWTGKVTRDNLQQLAGSVLFDWGCILGRVKIEKIEKIEITNNLKEATINFLERNRCHQCDFYNSIESEGLKDSVTLFEVIEKYAGSLEEPKPFYLIHWRWLK